jgi:alpha-galactosidase
MKRQQPREERKGIEPFLATYFSGGALSPFSFTYGGRPSSEFLGTWQFSQEMVRSDETRTDHVHTYVDPQTALEVCCACTVYADYPAVEWLVTFRNGGQGDTSILEDVQALDVELYAGGSGEYLLHRALGSSASRTDFAPVDESLPPSGKGDHGAKTRLAPVGGRSSNTTALPFFNVEADGEGVMVGIGWSGQWAVELGREGDTALRMRAGMELTHLRLHPGEQIRTPRILLLFWQDGDRMCGHNLLRRFILAHHTPQKDGRPIVGPLAASGGPACAGPLPGFEEFNKATEHNQIALAERYRQFGLDVEHFWIDAGWYEGGWPWGVGNWFPRADGFPHGLRPVSDALHKLDMGLLLWFEPERVHEGTWLDREHPDWILRLADSPRGLLNLGDPRARRWLTDHISGMIDSEGISVYRQDFNMDPLPYWRAVDAPDRQGMAEIRHVEGLYAFWDELLARHPGLIIDNCASGGRRIDLETVSRSIPLWRTDYQYFEPNGDQCHTYGLNFYLPCSGTGNDHPHPYSFRSAMSSALVLGWNLYLPDFPVDQARRLLDEFKQVRPLYYGDFNPLTAYNPGDEAWMAVQFHREDLQRGMFLAFRRPKSPDRTALFRLRGLDPDARYELAFADAGVQRTLRGAELGEGIEVTLEEAPGSLLVTYRQVP